VLFSRDVGDGGVTGCDEVVCIKGNAIDSHAY